MKIKKSLLFAFMSWMKNGSHGIAEKKKVIIMTKNGKQETITKGKDEYLEMNDYCEQRYRLFLKQWLEQGQDFLFELMAMGMISVKRNRQQIGLMGVVK